jgi:5-formyltetrahydrofolate cyclo-ligase
MLKKEARKFFREKRASLTEMERQKLDDLLLIQFQSIGLPFLHSVLSYWPIEENHEPGTHLVTEFLRFRNPELTIAYPVSDFETTTLAAIATDIDTPFFKKELNIFEPQQGRLVSSTEIDLVIVPLLGIDKNGYRVGYGKGFYDKYLASCRPDCIKLGLSYFEPIESIGDCNEFDVPLNLCITPQNTYVFQLVP